MYLLLHSLVQLVEVTTNLLSELTQGYQPKGAHEGSRMLRTQQVIREPPQREALNIVTILMGGDMLTTKFELMWSAVNSKPVLVIPGTKGYADYLAEKLMQVEEMSPDEASKHLLGVPPPCPPPPPFPVCLFSRCPCMSHVTRNPLTRIFAVPVPLYIACRCTCTVLCVFGEQFGENGFQFADMDDKRKHGVRLLSIKKKIETLKNTHTHTYTHKPTNNPKTRFALPPGQRQRHPWGRGFAACPSPPPLPIPRPCAKPPPPFRLH